MLKIKLSYFQVQEDDGTLKTVEVAQGIVYSADTRSGE